MKIPLSSLLFAAVALIGIGHADASVSQQDTLVSTLLRLIEHKEDYDRMRERRIEEIKHQLATPGLTLSQRYDINCNLAEEFSTFMADSATVYYSKNMEIAARLNDRFRLEESRLLMVSRYIVMGLYLDAGQLLKSVDRRNLPEELLRLYYDVYKSLYAANSFDNIHHSEHLRLSETYRDSLLGRLEKGSTQYRFMIAEKYYDRGHYEEAEAELLPLIDNCDFSTRESAMTAFSLSKIYRAQGECEKERRFLTLAACADIRASVKEDVATQILSDRLYREGNVKDAYLMIHSSMEDAAYCNARMRTFEIAKILPIIDSAYSEKIVREKKLICTVLVIVGVLSLFLLVAIIYTFRQMRRMAWMRKYQLHANHRLESLNEELNRANSDLTAVNDDLVRANMIKEAYITEFLDICSKYIDKLDSYRRSLYRLSSAGRHQEVFKVLRSTAEIDSEVTMLRQNFDRVFLNLFPNFVEQFNSLLAPDKRFEVKSGELNTELRIYALIRLGITDSSNIAKFLRYSPITIYNYRTRVRNRAAGEREHFEQAVQEII